MRDEVSLSSASGLSSDEASHLRALLLRHRIEEAESWLTQRGFNEARTERILFENERAVADAVYVTPVSYVIWAVVPLAIALVLYAMAQDSEESPAWPEAFGYKGPSLWLLAPFLAMSAFFGSRALLQVMRYVRARLRYPLRTTVTERW